MTKGQFETITKWQKEVFPDATALSKIAHLKKELPELEDAIKKRAMIYLFTLKPF